MAINLENYLSDNAKNMRRSAIRDLLSVATRPEIISFAGGFPNPETFPVEELKDIVNELMDKKPKEMLQYGSTEGSVALRREIVKRHRADGIDCDIENILVTTASQQAIDLVARIFINPGDTVVCGLPSYLGALQAFYSYQAVPVGCTKDEEADIVIKALIASGRRPKFIYAIPDFQNPSGETMDMAKRQALIDVARKYDMLILEDSPYKDIRFEGTSYPTLYSMAPERVILFGTFSKTFAPGFRLGWVLANKDIIDRLIVAKQSSDLCTPIFCQEIAAAYLEKGLFDKNLKKTIELYRGKRDLMLECLEKNMPEGVTWTRPEGGLFMFVTLPEYMNARELFDVAIQENVAFVTGDAFCCDGGGLNTLRLNFSFASNEQIVEGIARLGRAVKRMLK